MITDDSGVEWFTVPEAQQYSREFYANRNIDNFYSIPYIRRLCLWSGPDVPKHDRKLVCKKLSDNSREWLVSKESWQEYMINSNQGPHKEVTPHKRILNGKVVSASSVKFK